VLWLCPTTRVIKKHHNRLLLFCLCWALVQKQSLSQQQLELRRSPAPAGDPSKRRHWMSLMDPMILPSSVAVAVAVKSLRYGWRCYLECRRTR